MLETQDVAGLISQWRRVKREAHHVQMEGTLGEAHYFSRQSEGEFSVRLHLAGVQKSISTRRWVGENYRRRGAPSLRIEKPAASWPEGLSRRKGRKT